MIAIGKFHANQFIFLKQQYPWVKVILIKGKMTMIIVVIIISKIKSNNNNNSNK